MLSMRIGMGVGTWTYSISENKFYADPLTCSFFNIDYLEGGRGLPLERYINSMHPGDKERFRINTQRNIREGSCHSETFRVPSLSGSSRVMLSSGYFYCDSHGCPILCSGYTIDVGKAADSSRSMEDLRDHLEEVFLKSVHLNIPMVKYLTSMAILEVDDICRSMRACPSATLLN